MYHRVLSCTRYVNPCSSHETLNDNVNDINQLCTEVAARLQVVIV